MGAAERVTGILEERRAAQIAERREAERDVRIAELRAAQQAREDDERERERARVDKQRREEAARQAERDRLAAVKRTAEEAWLARRGELDRNLETARDLLGEAQSQLHRALVGLDLDEAAVAVGRVVAGERMLEHHQRARDLHEQADGRP